MSKRFIIYTDRSSPELEKGMVKLFGKDVAWWHKLSNYWMIVDKEDRFTAQAIADAIHDIDSYAQTMVTEVVRSSWSGRIYDDEAESTKAWLDEHWGRKGPEDDEGKGTA